MADVPSGCGRYVGVALPSSLVTTKIPPELCTEAIIAWDCLVYLTEEVPTPSPTHTSP
jgi:hypothetical protein